ncbi:nin [Pungitius sinensis]
MDDTQEQDQYEERLKEVFNSFDASGCGSLCPEELSDLCLSLQLDDATPALLHTLLQSQERLAARVDFDQFKNALILVLSSTLEPQQEQETVSKPESPEIKPKFVKGSKRYGRRSTPEFTEPISDFSEVTTANTAAEEDLEDKYDSAVPRKRERWNAHETSTEEYEAEGQMHLWNPDEPSTPRGAVNPLSTCLEERLRTACDELEIPWDGCAAYSKLHALCEHLRLELHLDVLQNLAGDGEMDVQEFVSRVLNPNKPPTPSASTPYRQLKRHHSTQPFDEGGRRIATSSALTSTIGMRLFSTLDDGTGFTPVEYILDAWMDEGIENSTEILQALNFSLDGKLSLGDLTMALENELLLTKNGIHQAALASFKAEIRHLLESVDRELSEKEKIRSDLEKAEKLKTQLATEVDERHAAIEHINNLNLRKLEQEHKEKLAAVRSELMREMDQMQMQAGLQREELEAEVDKIREEESFLRDHLSISVKENRRLEMELLDSTEKLVEAQSQNTKLQTFLENVMKEKLGDLDPGSADILLHEERIKELRSSYEAQYRELQDRIDELQSELQEFHSLGRVNLPCHKPLSEELESKSPGMESDPGLGSEDVQPFSMSLEAEMMLEQLKERHLQEMGDLQNQLESKINAFDELVGKQGKTNEDQKAAIALQYQQEVQALREEMASVQSHRQELQNQLQQAELERTFLQQKQAEEREELDLQEEEVGNLRRQLLESHTYSADLEEQLKALNGKQTEADENLVKGMDELRNRHAVEIKKLLKDQDELFEARLEEEGKRVQEEQAELVKRLLDNCDREKEQLLQRHEDELNARLEEAKGRFEEEREEIVQRLTEQWQTERAQLDEQNNESLQVVLEEGMLRLVREQEEKEGNLRERWESERAQLEERQEEAVLNRILQERLQVQEKFEQREKRLREEWERQRLQLEEDYEGMLQERLKEEREKLEIEQLEEQERVERLMAEERARLEESHCEAMRELSLKHTGERDALSCMLDKLRDDIAQERREIEISFGQRIKKVENRFSGDQQSVAERFQADLLKLEQHYQSELRALSEKHVEEKFHWEAQVQEALESAGEQIRIMQEAMDQEKKTLQQEWTNEIHEMESLHEKETEELVMKTRRLQSELDDFISSAQSTEIALSRQLNDLHNRLQGSLETKDKHVAQFERKALETELLLNQTVEDFKQEREELLSSQSELQAKYTELLSISEGQITERIELLTERDDLRMAIEELEKLLKQAAVDFELERKELQEHTSILEEKLENGRENDREGLLAERDVLKIRIKELELLFNQVMPSARKVKEEAIDESNKKNTLKDDCISFSGKEQEACLAPPVTSHNDDAFLAESSKQELVCFSLFLHEDVDLETSEALDGGIENADDDGENVPDTIDNRGDILPQVHQALSVFGDSNPRKVEEDGIEHEDPESMSCTGLRSDVHNISTAEYQNKAPVSLQMPCEQTSSPEAFGGADGDGENKDSCEREDKPRDVPSWVNEIPLRGDEPRHETAVDPSLLEETAELSPADAVVRCLTDDSHRSTQEIELVSDPEWEHLTGKEKDQSARYYLNEDANCEDLKLKALYNPTSHENFLLHEKISLLQQKTEILENLLAYNAEKIKTGHQILEENYGFKVKMLLLMEHVKELEVEASKTTDVQIRYEDCLRENAKLKDQNGELEKRVWSLESRVNIIHEFQDQQMALVDEISRMRAENAKLSKLFSELERHREILQSEESLPQRHQTVTSLEDSCEEFENQNTELRRAITELQGKSQSLNATTQAHSSEASRLADENYVLRQKIAALKEEDLKEVQEELIRTLQHLKNGKIEDQKAAEDFEKQISKLHLQSKRLEDEKVMLLEKNAQNISDIENLRQQLAELIKENESREALSAEEKNKLAACVFALEAELTKALQDSAQLEQRSVQLLQQLSGLRGKAVKMDSMESQLSHLVEARISVDKETLSLCSQLDAAQERVRTLDETLQAVNHQSTRLKSDLCASQQEREFLQHQVDVLHKKLQNVNDKNHVLEMALHSSGLQSKSKKLYREEMSRLVDQEQQLLRQENERLHAEVLNAKEDLVQSREKVRQLDASLVSLKQHKHIQSSLVKALEQENAFLKHELQAQKELSKDGGAGLGLSGLEVLQQENESLKVRTFQLSTELIATYHAHLGGIMPPSPHRMPRGQHRGEDPDNMQDQRERKMKTMEARMREIELSLRNVKMLLKEKVVQLKDQLHKNGKADLLIRDLYEENTELLNALQRTEQRQKITEKKNYLLEEKISSLNKIVRDLNPSPLPSLPYHYKCT